MPNSSLFRRDKFDIIRGWGGEICKERSDGIAFCSTKNFYIFGKTRHSRMTESEENHNPIKTLVFMLF